MQLDEVLAGITALGFDTAPFIYLVERHPTYVDIVREVVRREGFLTNDAALMRVTSLRILVLHEFAL
jgi:hypothetical protein